MTKLKKKTQSLIQVEGGIMNAVPCLTLLFTNGFIDVFSFLAENTVDRV
jgi:hypothetical protein